MSTYYSPNPLPADIDWERVGKTLGLTIAQGHPSDEPTSTVVPDSHCGLLGAEADEVDGVGEFPNLLRLRRTLELCGLTGPEGDVSDGFVEGFTLGRHFSSIQSVDESPEPSGAAGSASLNSAAPDYAYAFGRAETLAEQAIGAASIAGAPEALITFYRDYLAEIRAEVDR